MTDDIYYVSIYFIFSSTKQQVLCSFVYVNYFVKFKIIRQLSIFVIWNGRSAKYPCINPVPIGDSSYKRIIARLCLPYC